jgi:uncharacterized protein
MRVTVLGATGGTGRHLVTQALERGHQVGAVVRDPGHAALPAHPHLTVYRGDVHDAASIADAIAPGSVVVSGLGVASKKVGRLTARLLRAGFGAEYDDKVTADAAVLDAGGTVLHSGPLSDRADDPGTRALPVSAAGRRFFPHRTSRATIARLMFDEAETPTHPGQLITPHPQ